jgi:hypothetical protein
MTVQYINRLAPFPRDPAIALLDAPEGVGLDLLNLRTWIRDRGTGANNFLGDPNDKLAYESPASKYVLNSAGLLVPGTTLRTHHDGAGDPLGLLVEEQSTNLLPNSETRTGWISASGLASDVAVAPDGETTADRITEPGSGVGTAFSFRESSAIMSSGVALVFSQFFKAETCPFVFLNIEGTTSTNWVTAIFDLSTGAMTQSAVGAGSGTLHSHSIVSVGNGWYRCSITASVTIATASYLAIGTAGAATGNSFAPYGLPSFERSGRTFLTWGHQMETGNKPASSYVKTTSGSVTRAADDITLPLADFPWSGGSGVLRLNGDVVDPVVSGSDLDISGIAFAEGVSLIESLTWVPS